MLSATKHLLTAEWNCKTPVMPYLASTQWSILSGPNNRFCDSAGTRTQNPYTESVLLLLTGLHSYCVVPA